MSTIRTNLAALVTLTPAVGTRGESTDIGNTKITYTNAGWDGDLGTVAPSLLATLSVTNLAGTITADQGSQSLVNGSWVSVITPTDLPKATKTTAGVIVVGDGLNVVDGLVSATQQTIPAATKTTPGVVTVGSRLSVVDGVVSADVQSVPAATKTTAGVVTIGAGLNVVDGVLGAFDLYAPLATLLGSAPAGTIRASATDVPGVNLWASAGKWVGSLGNPTQAQLTAATTTYLTSNSVKATVNGIDRIWTGTAWQSDLIVGPFADLDAANAWAAANPSSLFPGLLATAAGVQITWSGSAWVGASSGGVMENIEPTKISMNRLPRGATFGDSTADCGGPRGTNGISDIEYCITSAGVQSNGSITVKGCPLFTKRRFNLVANCGRVGETTTQMLARSSIAYSNIRKSIEDVIAKKPDFVMFHGGSINDITSFDSSTPSASFSDVSNRHIKIVKRFLNAGVPVIDTGIYGYDGNGGVEATKLAAIRAGIVQINSEISAEASKYKQWMFVSSEGVVSTSGAYIAGMTDDGTHLSTSGANAIGAAMATEYDKLFVCRGTSAEQFTTVYSGATWANGTQPTDSPYVGPTGINVGTQTCTPQLWSIQFDVTAATNELLVLWTSIKALLGVAAGDSLMLQIMVTVKKDGSLFPANISTRCWIYDTVSHLNAIQHIYASNAYVDQQFYATVAQASMGANTRVGITLNNLPIGAGYSLELTPMVIVKRVQSSPMLM